MSVDFIACGVIKAPEDTFCTECGGEIYYDDDVYLCTNYDKDEQNIVCNRCYYNSHL